MLQTCTYKQTTHTNKYLQHLLYKIFKKFKRFSLFYCLILFGPTLNKSVQSILTASSISNHPGNDIESCAVKNNCVAQYTH